jgi:hypothetical protein
MPRVTSRSWTAKDLEQLRKLAMDGASPARAAARFNRSIPAVQIRAKREGFPFQDVREVKRKLRHSEAVAREERRNSNRSPI